MKMINQKYSGICVYQTYERSLRKIVLTSTMELLKLQSSFPHQMLHILVYKVGTR
jgi:hypothetical protein